MKKNLILVLLAIAGSANAGLVLKTTGRTYVCPKGQTTSGKSIVYTVNNGEVTVYTPDFPVDKTFRIPTQEHRRVSFTEEAKVMATGVIAVPQNKQGIKNYRLDYNGFNANSQEEMISKLQSESGGEFTAFTDAMGNPACSRKNATSAYFLYSSFGEQYPTR